MADKLAKMRSADLRQVLVLQSPPSGVGDRGQQTGSWSDVATVRAKVESLSGDEAQQAHQLAGQVSHRVTFRYRSRMTVRQRFKLGSRYLNIGYINDIEERGLWVECLCREDV